MSLSTLLVLADGRLPAGAHAHSGGVEAAVAAGRVHDLATLRSFLVGRTATAGEVAAAFAAATCRALTGPQLQDALGGSPDRRGDEPGGPRAFAGVDSDRVRELDDGIDARTASPALRAASRAQGRALLRAAARIWPTTPSTTAGKQPHHPVAVGIAAAAAGLRPREAALVAVYGGITGSASAAVRLLGLDPYAVHALVAELAPECDRLAARAADRADLPVDDLPAGSAILLDIGAEQHATWEVRLFAS
ncbi:urease accessory protein UreF [Asanoa iriomotensis]|uniref:Urease accessory protein UreF n=1 Tax=Asanoa iriomotensis TaxID=234613 RepID=A0ABQ4C2G8_9ACTN|nr:urease accessory UreF family protein [Asanoa iriomotensis]GIF56973.1 urease accessory protein UreF [Asanoa iriomotensis]